MLQRLRPLDALRSHADDDTKFDLPVELLGDRLIVKDGRTGADNRRWRLREHHRLARQIGIGVERLCRFCAMRGIFEADDAEVLQVGTATCREVGGTYV